MRVAVTALLLAVAVGVVATEDDDFFADPFAVSGETGDEAADGGRANDWESLFGDPDMIDDVDEDSMADAPQDDLLRREGVRWGGRIGGSLVADWNWDTVWTSDFDPREPTSDSFSPRLDAGLFFDARPDARFRVFGRFGFALTTDGQIDLAGLDLDDLLGGIPGFEDVDIDDLLQPADDPTGTAPGLELAIRELFVDYAWQDRLFFRYGKHTIRWGTGYFFSPADVLNLTAVDAEDPTADREGPLSLRTVYPFGVGNTAYLYLITNSGAGIADVAVAPRIEFASGSGEYSIAVYYQRSLAPRLIGLASMSVRDVDLFAEGVLLWGSDRVFVRRVTDQPAALETYRVDDRLFALATAGARYMKSFENDLSLLIAAQYFHNGEGYARDEGLLTAASALLFAPTTDPALSFADLSNFGRHYAAATASLSNLLIDRLSLTAFALVNLTDLSGIASPTISYRFFDRFSLSLSSRFTFGPEDGEFTNPAALFTGGPAKPTFGLSLSLGLPGGSF
ncbi:MAG: hypothetical protein EA382_18505 [Spirochaetaceae bacterium]|nr:MAG: hypothetical protein EA382_18505 [Spirochaetaceae bacterium]